VPRSRTALAAGHKFLAPSFPLSSSYALAEREADSRMAATLDTYCHTGPLSVMLIDWVSARRFFITPLMVTEPPAELIPLLSVAM